MLFDRTYREEALAKILGYPDWYISLSLVRGLRLWFNYSAAYHRNRQQVMFFGGADVWREDEWPLYRDT